VNANVDETLNSVTVPSQSRQLNPPHNFACSRVLGAPVPLANPRFTVGFAALVIALGTYLPLFGLSLVLVAATERLLFQRFPATQRWLGLGRGSI
jgi:hypothetical protein